MYNNNAYQQALSERYKQMEQLNRLRQNQKTYGFGDYLSTGNSLRNTIGTLGKGLSASNNSKVANFGNNLYNYSGQKFVDNFNKNPFDTTKNAFNTLSNKIQFGSGSLTGAEPSIANAVSDAGSAVSEASTAAGNAASSAGNVAGSVGTGLSLANNIGGLIGGKDKTNSGIDAGIDAVALGLQAVPVWGQVAGAALEIGKGIKNMVMGKKQEQAQKAASQTESINEGKAQETKQNAMQNIANNGQEQIQQPIGEEDKKKQMLEKVLGPQIVMSDSFGRGPEDGFNMIYNGKVQPYTTSVFSNMPQSPQSDSLFNLGTNYQPDSQSLFNEPSGMSMPDLSKMTNEELQALINEEEKKYA